MLLILSHPRLSSLWQENTAVLVDASLSYDTTRVAQEGSQGTHTHFHVTHLPVDAVSCVCEDTRIMIQGNVCNGDTEFSDLEKVEVDSQDSD